MTWKAWQNVHCDFSIDGDCAAVEERVCVCIRFDYHLKKALDEELERIMDEPHEWRFLHPKMTLEHLGLLPEIIRPDDPRPVADQLEDRYSHGGGYRPLPGVTISGNGVRLYPGDPPIEPVATIRINDEVVWFYPDAFIAIVQPDGSAAMTRVD